MAPNGAIGAWSLSGPCPSIDSLDARPGLAPSCEAAERRTIANSVGDFDWGEILGLPANGSAAAAVSVSLRLESTFHGWLLVGADGKLRVKVDGQRLYRRERSVQRGRAFVPIPLSLQAGTHSLVLEFERSSNRSTFSALLRERNSNQAPRHARVQLPTNPSAGRLTEELLSFSLRLQSAEPLELVAELGFPAGAAALDLPVWLELGSTGQKRSTRRWQAGWLRAESAVREPWVIHLGDLNRLTAAHDTSLSLGIGTLVLKRRLWLTPDLLASLKRAVLASHLPIVRDSATTRHDAIGATLQAHVERVSERVADPSRSTFEDALRRLNELLLDLEQGRDPSSRPGYVDAFIRSPFDRRPTSVMAYLPENLLEGPTARLPLVVALHGYNGTPRKILDAFLDRRDSQQRPRNIGGLVLAPAAHGNTFFRGAGESAVLDALDWASNRFPVDPARVYITGVSMGGTGAAEIALKHSQRFAAAAPLCGYHSYFVRRDTANKPLRPWEPPLMHRFSPASLAESGNDVPMFVAHGLKDPPLENSRVLISRYRALGYRLTEDWPNLGHSVWTKSFHDAAMYTWLSQWSKNLEPTHVVVASASVRHGKKFWLEIRKRDASAEPSLLDGRILSPTELELKTRGVTRFRIGPTRHLDSTKPLQLSVDGQRLAVDAGEIWTLERSRDAWQVTAALERSEPGENLVEGPWSELFSQPFAVVYGTQNPTTAALNREVAERLVEPRVGVDLRIPILADREFDPSSSLTRVVYVGTSNDHAILAKLMDRLPLRNTEQGIRLGTREFSEPDVGAVFVYPDPDRGDRLLGVVTGNSAEGLWRVLALPALVPDFVVFDHGIDPAAGESVLGPHAFVRAAGFFRSDWSLPENLSDPLAPAPR